MGDFVLQLLDQYGVLSGLLIFTAFIIIKNFKDIALQIHEGSKEVAHAWRAHKRRGRAEQEVQTTLLDLQMKTHAEKVALFEEHNGGYNLAGQPLLKFNLFLFLNELGFPEDCPSPEFTDVSFSTVPTLANQLRYSEVYRIPISKLKEVYPRLYKQLQGSEVTDVIFKSVHGKDEQLGFIMLGVKKTDINDIISDINQAVHKLAIILSDK